MQITAAITALHGKFYVQTHQPGLQDHLYGPFKTYEKAVENRDRKVPPWHTVPDTFDCWELRFPRQAWAYKILPVEKQNAIRPMIHDERVIESLWRYADQLEKQNPIEYRVARKIFIGDQTIMPGEWVLFMGDKIRHAHGYLSFSYGEIWKLIDCGYLKRVPLPFDLG